MPLWWGSIDWHRHDNRFSDFQGGHSLGFKAKKKKKKMKIEKCGF
jgi:hypothetical protein